MEFKPKFNIINGTIGVNRSELCEQALKIAERTQELNNGAVSYEGIATICNEWLENRMTTIEKWGDSRIAWKTEPQVNIKDYMELTKDFSDSLVCGNGLKHQREYYTLEVLSYAKAPNEVCRNGICAIQGLLTTDKYMESVVTNSLEKRFSPSWVLDDIEGMGIKIQKGEKITRLIVKVLRKMVDSLEGEEKAIATKEMDIISQNYSILTEKFKTIKQEKTVYLSVDVRDFLRCSFGANWESCHKLGGCYGSGAISYALNPRVAIAYVESDRDSEKLEWRQIVYMDETQNLFVGSRQYKTSNHRYTKAVRKIIENIYGVEFNTIDYTNTDKVQELIQCELIKSGSEFAYNDIHAYGGIDTHLWAMLPKGAIIGNMKKIDIQHTHIYCIDCGEKMTEVEEQSWVLCPRCQDEMFYCEYCGQYHHEYDITYIPSTNEYVCDYCVSDNFTRCEDCYEYHSNENLYYVNGVGDVCQDCLDKYHYCEECEEYTKDELTRCHDGEDVCPHCLETWYRYCDYCESYEKRNWVYEKTDKHGQVWNVCCECESDWELEHGEEEQE